MPQDKTFTKTHILMDCDCDANHFAMPGPIFRMTQQISTDQCTTIGLTSEFYEEQDAVFLLAKQQLLWEKLPKAGDTLVLCTMPQNSKRAICKRVTTIESPSGERYGMVDSRWVLVRTSTRHILRRVPEAFENRFADEVPFELPVNVKKAEETQPAGVGVASYSRCDHNGHMNNTHYADVSADTLPIEQLDKQAITSITIHYRHEVPRGESFALQQGQLDDGTWYVCGVRDDKVCFESNLVLTPIDQL